MLKEFIYRLFGKISKIVFNRKLLLPEYLVWTWLSGLPPFIKTLFSDSVTKNEKIIASVLFLIRPLSYPILFVIRLFTGFLFGMFLLLFAIVLFCIYIFEKIQGFLKKLAEYT